MSEIPSATPEKMGFREALRGAREREAEDRRSPINDLIISIAPMMVDVELRCIVLEQPDLDGARRDVVVNSLQHANSLLEKTEWEPIDLLDRMGCRPELFQIRSMSEDKLSSARCLLGLADHLTGLVDTRSDRRAVVREYGKILCASGREIGEIESAFEAGVFSAASYIGLGEISLASIATRDQLGLSNGEEDGNPYSSAPTVHLSGPRISMYLQGREDLMGVRVYRNIAAHVEECEPCNLAVENRQLFE